MVGGLGGLGGFSPLAAKRNVFFSFHYADIMRVNVVRKSGEFKTNETPEGGRNIEGFYDKSLWESRKLNGPESLKNLIRDGVKNTSVVCVLAGSNTWQRRWVRYEIARSVVDEKGLLTVHVNGIRHHQEPFQPHPLGHNPLSYMGIARESQDKFYLCELFYGSSGWNWQWYQDYTHPVNVPKYMNPPEVNQPVQLSQFTREYNWVNGGHTQIGNWVDLAAQDAGR